MLRQGGSPSDKSGQGGITNTETLESAESPGFAPPSDIWSGATVLITGGTGSFGGVFTRRLLNSFPIEAIRILSRDEYKQHKMDEELKDDRIRYFVGDVRDLERLRRAMRGADIVVHTAALKQVPLCEYNPLEAVKTNVLGAANVIEAGLDADVARVIALSTDKAANPINLYGATKLCAEKLIVQGNSYAGQGRTRLACVRYGNVLGSRGSVLPLFLRQQSSGTVTITDPQMTRFWLTLEQATDFVIARTADMAGGEVFVPKTPSISVVDLAAAAAPGARMVITGIRPGEKLHEVLVTHDEARRARDAGAFYVIEPEHRWWNTTNWTHGTPVPEGFVYASDTNTDRLSASHLRELVAAYKAVAHE